MESSLGANDQRDDVRAGQPPAQASVVGQGAVGLGPQIDLGLDDGKADLGQFTCSSPLAFGVMEISSERYG